MSFYVHFVKAQNFWIEYTFKKWNTITSLWMRCPPLPRVQGVSAGTDLCSLTPVAAFTPGAASSTHMLALLAFNDPWEKDMFTILSFVLLEHEWIYVYAKVCAYKNRWQTPQRTSTHPRGCKHHWQAWNKTRCKCTKGHRSFFASLLKVTAEIHSVKNKQS